MICPNCKSETYRLKTFFSKEGKTEQCENCPDKYIPKPVQGLQIRGDMYGIGTAAHCADINRRKLDKDGKTYRDYGRKVFTLR